LIASPSDNLRANPDGSTTLFVQKNPPGKGKQVKGLPALADFFIPKLRMAWPADAAPSILNRRCASPMVKRVQ
jgi:hypothetical protein